MALTALAIAQEFCKRQGLPVPTVLVSATDDTAAQINGLMNEGISDLIQRYQWPQLNMLQTFNHAGGADYLAYDLSGLSNFRNMVQDTLWNATGRLRVAGPATPDEWTTIITMQVAPTDYTFRKRLSGIYIFPEPDPLNSITFSFEYVSSKGVWDGASYTDFYETDTSTPLLESAIVLQDLKWRWRKEKGLPYAEDARILEEMIVNSLGREPARQLVLDGPSERGIVPGVFVPAGSWNLP